MNTPTADPIVQATADMINIVQTTEQITKPTSIITVATDVQDIEQVADDTVDLISELDKIFIEVITPIEKAIAKVKALIKKLHLKANK